MSILKVLHNSHDRTFLHNDLYKKLLLAFASLLFTCSSISAQVPANWQRYSATGDEFSVELPHLPTTIKVSRPQRMFEREKPRGNLYGTYDDGIVYAILSFPNRNRKERLDTFINELKYYPLNGNGATFDREIELDGFPGKQYVFGGQLLRGRIQFYITRNHVHLLLATGEDISKPGVTQFFSSFSLAGKLSGIEIPKTHHLTEAGMTVFYSQEAAKQSSETALTGRQVTRKALIVSKPEPSYTEEARREQVTGTVVLRGVFSSSGRLTNIIALGELPSGLTEQAIIAAKNIRFIPAMKDGKYVSMLIQLEYNFNLY